MYLYIIYKNKDLKSIPEIVDDEKIAKEICNERNVNDDILYCYKKIELNKYYKAKDYVIKITEFDKWIDEKTIQIEKYLNINKEKTNVNLNPLGYVEITLILDKEKYINMEEDYYKNIFLKVKNFINNFNVDEKDDYIKNEATKYLNRII